MFFSDRPKTKQPAQHVCAAVLYIRNPSFNRKPIYSSQTSASNLNTSSQFYLVPRLFHPSLFNSSLFQLPSLSHKKTRARVCACVRACVRAQVPLQLLNHLTDFYGAQYQLIAIRRYYIYYLHFPQSVRVIWWTRRILLSISDISNISQGLSRCMVKNLGNKFIFVLRFVRSKISKPRPCVKAPLCPV